MNPFVAAPFIIIFREGLKVCIVSLFVISFLDARSGDKSHAASKWTKAFIIGLILSLTLSVAIAAFTIHNHIDVREEIGNFIAYSFAMLYILAVIGLYQTHGIELLGPLKKAGNNSFFVTAVCFAVPFMLFLPENVGAFAFLHETALMKGNTYGCYFSAFMGLVLSAGPGIPIASYLRKKGIGSFFDLPGLLFSLAVIKLIGGGIRGFAEMTLVSSVQRGAMKMLHDMIHQLFVILMLPDHPLLTPFVWRFVGFLFGSTLAIVIALFVLAAPLAIYIVKTIFSPMTGIEMTQEGAHRRAFIAAQRSRRRKVTAPVFISLLLVFASWYAASGERSTSLYLPQPLPVVSDKGVISIPLRESGDDLFDGRIHKFSFSSGSDVIRILIVKKPDGRLATCLDACEICPQEGYGQSHERIVCLYCKTPIPLKSIGEPGGCNPIPLNAVVTDRDVRIQASDILKKWQDVKTGKTKGSVK